VASADLGGLGPEEGVATLCTWTPPSRLPSLLPWLAVLLLFLLKQNRCAQAWWVWLPLVGITTLTFGLQPVFSFIPSNAVQAMADLMTALAFGLTALWLVSPHLTPKPRILAFLGILATCGIFAAVVYTLKGDWVENSVETGSFLVILAFCVLQLALAIILTSLMCRRRYTPMRFLIWLLAWLTAAWFAAAAPFFILAAPGGGAGETLVAFVTGVLSLALGSFLIVLPFLILAFASAFYRQRVLDLLQLPGARAPIASVPTGK
jgi:hypothetical protein